jgi:hypothetical protein
LLFGMLIHSKEGKLCLEDLDGVVELDFSQLVRSGEVVSNSSSTTFFFFELGSTERRALH